MTIEPEDLARPASLTLWSSEPDAPKAVEPREYPTLKEALHRAGIAMSDESAAAWILTESGLILTPAWLRNHLVGETASPAAAAPTEPTRLRPRRGGRIEAALPAMPHQRNLDRMRRAAGIAPLAGVSRDGPLEAIARS